MISLLSLQIVLHNSGQVPPLTGAHWGPQWDTDIVTVSLARAAGCVPVLASHWSQLIPDRSREIRQKALQTTLIHCQRSIVKNYLFLAS